MLDEARRDKPPKIGDIIRQIAKQIDEGSIDLPPAPYVMIKLNEAMTRDDMSIQDIVRTIMADQILTSKILPVVNSSFYSPASEITSLQQAIIFMGLKSVLSPSGECLSTTAATLISISLTKFSAISTISGALSTVLSDIFARIPEDAEIRIF